MNCAVVVVSTLDEIGERVLQTVCEMLEAAETRDRATCGTRIERIDLPPFSEGHSRFRIDSGSQSSGSGFEADAESDCTGACANDPSCASSGESSTGSLYDLPDGTSNDPGRRSTAASRDGADDPAHTAKGEFGDGAKKRISRGSAPAS